MKSKGSLYKKYPASAPCRCEICLGYCVRPGWWTVEEARKAVGAGYAGRMMLEVAPDRSFGVLAPAFYGCEGSFGLNEYAARGCNFLKNKLCELYGSGLTPLECRFCHHDRPGQGLQCHADIERDWLEGAGRALVGRWCRQMGLWNALPRLGLEKLRVSLRG